jgi:transcriptional regulator with XRE-family HTH domain
MTSLYKGSYKAFAQRLVAAMTRAGHTDSRSPSGISVALLSKTMGVSEQICRRYLRGDALPDHDKIIKIARFLVVSPGWLLFGEQAAVVTPESSEVRIDAQLLHYILARSQALYRLSADNTEDFPDFVLALIKDINTIEATGDTLKKIIDLAVDSICSFEDRKRTKQTSQPLFVKRV